VGIATIYKQHAQLDERLTL